MTTPKQTVLLTGATGNVGAVTLEHILSSTPHDINLVVRNADRAIPHFKSTYPTAASSGRLTYTSIPDMTVPGVFDEVVKGVETIIHIATPITFDDKRYKEDMILPTWVVNKSILEAAKKSGSVRRIIICGSIVSTLNILKELQNPDVVISSDRWNPQVLEESTKEWFPAYSYAKTYGEKNTWAWVEENKASIDFDVVFLLPPAITGRSPQMGYKPTADHPGGIGQVYSALIGKSKAEEVLPIWLDVDDVARTHVLSIDRSRVPGNERYFTAASDTLDLRAVGRELRSKYPETRKVIPEFEETQADLSGKIAKWDTEKADKIFGPWKGQVESIKEAVFDVLRYEEKNGVQ